MRTALDVLKKDSKELHARLLVMLALYDALRARNLPTAQAKAEEVKGMGGCEDPSVKKADEEDVVALELLRCACHHGPRRAPTPAP